jgi:hypothetical protein
MIYTHIQIDEFIAQGFDYELPESVRVLLMQLAKAAGATGALLPQKQSFKRDPQWTRTTAPLLPFHATKLVPRTAPTDVLRVLLNKMTDATYDDIARQITEIVADNLGTEGLAHVVFEIASTNQFYSQLYARLCRDLVNNFGQVFAPVIASSLDAFMGVFQTVESGNPDKDYDQFCRINKDNDRRRALAEFFANLVRLGVVLVARLQTIIDALLLQLHQAKTEPGRVAVVDEIAVNLAILCTPKPNEQQTKAWLTANVVAQLHELAAIKIKEFPSVSSKTIFKFRDLVLVLPYSAR